MLLKLIFFFPSNQESSCSSMWNTPSGYLVGIKCSHTVHPFPHGLLLLLTQGIGPLQSFHFSITWGDYHFLERIITSHSLPWGIITPQRGLSPLTLYPVGDCHPLTFPTITLGDYQPRHRVTRCCLLEYFILFPHNYSCSVACFHSKGYGLGTLIQSNRTAAPGNRTQK